MDWAGPVLNYSGPVPARAQTETEGPFLYLVNDLGPAHPIVTFA